ncbi:MAG: hypothetical protein AABY22_23760 [Nanoarchaeota archaeon]
MTKTNLRKKIERIFELGNPYATKAQKIVNKLVIDQIMQEVDTELVNVFMKGYTQCEEEHGI